MHTTIFEGKESIAEALRSFRENPRALKITRVIDSDAISDLLQLAMIIEPEPRREAVMDELETLLPDLTDGLKALANGMNLRLRGTLRYSNGLAGPMLARATTTPHHLDSYEISNYRPYAYGPCTISLGLQGRAVFEDYGIPERVGSTEIDNGSYARTISSAVQPYFNFAYKLEPLADIEQLPGDLVLLPGMPYPSFHRVSEASEDRIALVTSGLLVDTVHYDPTDSTSMVRLRDKMYRSYRPAPVS